METRNFYELLGVAQDSTPQQLKDGYRRQAMQWHPDRHEGMSAKVEAHLRFKQIAGAYRTLRDPQAREQYDRELALQQQQQTGAQSSQSEEAGRGKEREARKASGPSEAEAERMFYEQMLDLARELAARGFPETGIAKALIGLGCPETMAAFVAARSIFSNSHSPDSTPHGAGPTTKEPPRSAAPQQPRDIDRPTAQTRRENYTPKSEFRRAGHLIKPAPETRLTKTTLFGLVLIICFVCGWGLTLLSLRQSSDPAAFSSWSQLIGSTFMWGRSIATILILMSVAFIGWVTAQLFRLGPKGRGRMTLGSVVVVAASLAYGGYLQMADEQQPSQGRQTTVNPPPASTTSANVEAQANPSQPGEGFNTVVSQIERRYPFLNPDSKTYSKESAKWVLNRIDFHKQQGSEPIPALLQAISDMEVAMKENQARARPAPAPSSPNEEAQRNALTSEEQVTISMGCYNFQLNGDIRGFQACMRRQTAIAAASPPIPSMDGLSIDEKITINMACNDLQMAGDVGGYKSCIRSQLSMVRH